MTRLAAMLILGVLVSAVAYAQSATVGGQVVDSQGGVVVDAEVTLDGGGVRARKVRTNAQGRFAFDSIVAGRYTLQVRSPGFITWAREVVAGSGLTPLTVMLEVAGVIEDVQVSGTAPFDLERPAPTASRLGLTPLATPASVAVVSGDLIRDLGTPTLVVAKALAPGIVSSSPMGNGGNVIHARGFTGANSVKQLFNGMEIYNAGNVVSFPFDPWNVDHIGVLYGPASVLYGSGAIGGAVNVVARRPDPAQRRNEMVLEVGRFNTYHAAFDSTGPLSDGVSYRADASVYDSGHWVERGDSNSVAVSGSVRFDATDRLRFTLSNDFGNQNPSQYLGTPVLNNAPVEGLRYVNYNVEDAQLNFTDNWTTLETIWTASPTVSVHNSTYVMYHDRIYHDVPNYAYVPTTGQVNRTRFRDIQDTYETQVGSTGYVKQSGSLLGRPHELLAGFDVNRNYYHRNDNVRGGSSIVDAVDFAPGNFLDFYDETSQPFYRIHVNQVAAFGEFHWSVADRLSLVAGVRQDHYHVNRFDSRLTATTTSDHNATGWNAGAVYDVVPGLAVYGQVAAASDPVNSLASIQASQQGFSLSAGRQVEGGVKQLVLDNRVEWTFAAYRIVKEDVLTRSVDDPTLTEQAGQQSSRGVEGSLAFTTGPVRVSVNGTVLHARFDEFRAAIGGRSVSLAGNVPVDVPERSANVLLFWDVTPAWEARGVVRYVGRRFADNTNADASRIPSYTILDLGARWRATSRMSLDFRLDNALDEVYADSGSTTAWLLGQPRSASLGLHYRF